jgi:hypothetical protein
MFLPLRSPLFHGRKAVAPEPNDAFDAITDGLSDLGREAFSEQLGEAGEIVAAGVSSRSFADEVRRVGPGEVVTVVAVDGEPLRGRVLCVGADWMRVGEVAEATGTRRTRLLRVHDLRLEAVVRVTRETAP